MGRFSIIYQLFLILVFALNGCHENSENTLVTDLVDQTSKLSSEKLYFEDIQPASLTDESPSIKNLIEKGMAEGWSGLEIIKSGEQVSMRYFKFNSSGTEIIYSNDLITGEENSLPEGVAVSNRALTNEERDEFLKDPVAFISKRVEELMASEVPSDTL